MNVGIIEVVIETSMKLACSQSVKCLEIALLQWLRLQFAFSLYTRFKFPITSYRLESKRTAKCLLNYHCLKAGEMRKLPCMQYQT